MARAFLGLGSNMGDRQKELDFAIGRLREHPQITLVRAADYLETDPVGYLDQDKFLNSAAEIETSLSPYQLLAVLQKIEHDAGRIRTIRWGPRTLDIDILLYEDLVLDDPDLTIPHPRMREREFVLLPLSEIAPDAVVPPENLTVSQLLRQYRQSR
ncbi:MAG: 2-amino-4-hydroxy-6-hydroxymethyldihydropteridine diphosphokinase [Bacillota bacterium]|nr:2-amino-4-hydroxy-6-hydroxymethyldihydropteridine diphosphokinase [Bacillota bacterium]MDW7684749.1 2-amino-4-hydroxy-6-hydroxymethyldihydropteridine diphosphokinase [Bacillota bacterium]